MCRFINEYYDEATNPNPAADADATAAPASASASAPAEHASTSSGQAESVQGGSNVDEIPMKQLVDRPFQEKVWTWLTRNPEVSVGENREGNQLSLTEVEATHKRSGDANARSAFLRQSSRQPSAAGAGAASDEPAQSSSEATEGLQVFVSTSRMWLAVAGHERDDARVPPLEFALLSIIAMHKGKGIAQPELTRLSGQDKRSVPKRTDKLARNGYIEKKAVHFKSTRTSLCTLQRFVGTAEATNDEEDHSLYDFKAILDKLFGILKECKVITRDDLKEYMDMKERKPRKILGRALRKLERIGCLEKVKAVSQYNDILKSKHLSIRLIREPTEEDLRLFYEDSRALVAFLNKGDNDDEGEKDGEDETEGFTPHWTPDRPFYNQIYSLIEASGTQGMTNLEIVKSFVGMFYRRPTETTMNRLVEAWPYAQPLNLRKFAIIRDSALHGTISHYVHYTFDNFQKLVDEGKASRDAVEQVFPMSNKSRKGTSIAPLDAVPELDQYGFPLNEKPAGLVKNGSASLRECLEIAKPTSMPITRWQPRLVWQPDGTGEVVMDNPHYSTMRADRGSDRPGDEDQSTVADEGEAGAAVQRPTAGEKRGVPHMEDEEHMESVSSRKRAKIAEPPKEMSEKEHLESLGMDMTWTEYAALVIPRPTPGAYLTPFGKRRPTGHARGRPRKSRILIIKSARLKEFEWFTAPEPEPEPQAATGPEDTITTESIGGAQPSETEDRRVSMRKRKRVQYTEPSPELAEQETVVADQPIPDMDSVEVSEQHPKLDRPRKGKGGRRSIPTSPLSTQPSEQVATVSGEATVSATTASEPALMETDRDQAREEIQVVERTSQPVETSQRPETAASGLTSDTTDLPLNDVEIKREPDPDIKPSQSRRRERGAGTVAMLRRRIIMEILEKCHGVYPVGSEMWYPFTTAWMKIMKQSGKPDMRTIKMAVKTLVDSGKVRQLSFSGRNSKGIIITRSMITNVDIPTNDPRVLDMQQKVLATDPGIYVPPEVEVDPSLRKSHKAALPPMTPRKEHEEEEEVTVIMHHAPHRVRFAEERMRMRNAHEEARIKALQQRITRLASTYPRSRNAVAVPPQWEEDFDRRRNMAHWISKLAEHGIAIPGQKAPATSKPLRPPSLPRNVEEILSIMGPIEIPEDVPDLASARFFAEVNAIQRWEIEVFDLYRDHIQPVPNHFEYINYPASVPYKAASIEGPIRWADNEVAPEPSPAKLRKLAARPTASAAEELTLGPPRQRRRRRKEPIQKERRLASLGTQKATGKKTEARGNAARRNRGLRSISTDLQRRIITALVVLRTLAGGNEGRTIDWSLIQLAFPDADISVITRRGKSLLAKHRLQISKLQSEFQERFLEAYEMDQVPPIDYEHIEEYNWAWLVDWASRELEFSSDNRLPDLPSTRARFGRVFEIRAEPPQQLDEIYQQSSTTTIPRRQQLYSSVPFSISLEDSKKAPISTDADRLAAAKTWVRANIVAPDDTFDPKAAEAMLAYVGADLLSEAKQSLIQEGAIHQRNKGRFIPGRSYDLTDNFVHTIGRRRQIDSTQLKRAATFKKTILDPEFHLNGKYKLNYDAEDGDILALINLVQSDMISIHPINPPRDKYGLTDGGYLTRMMDKGKLRFDVEFRPVEGRYIYSSPLEATPKIPRGDLPSDFPASATEKPLCKIPLWFDIHGNVVQVLWESAAASVLGIVASRPGSKPKDIARMLCPCLAAWEVELVLDYMVEVGVVDRIGSPDCKASYVKEWWWMALSIESDA